MELKNSIHVGFLGKYADRFREYHPHRSLEERLETARNIPGVDGIEVVFPQFFADMEGTIQLIKDSGLPVSAINLNVKGEALWKNGSFTNPDPEIRAQAVHNMKNAMDLAAELGSDKVHCCPLIDGHDYNFQVDYRKQWKWMVEGIKKAASYRNDIKISLEYKPNEIRDHVILADMGRTLHLCNMVGLPHVGVTMDAGHALAAQENPAEMVCLAAEANRLFYVHFNDNDRAWDWDMLPGSVHLWDLIETLYYLERLNWSGWLSYDVLSRQGDPVETFAVTIRIMDRAKEFMYKMGPDRIESLIAEKGTSPAKVMDFLFEHLGK